MKTFNNDYIRAYDKFKEDIFHSKKQQIKADLRNKNPKPSPPALKKTFPWRPLIKLSSLTAISYLAYNYTESAIDYTIKHNYFDVLDLISFRTLKADASLKLKTIFTHPQQFNKITRYSNFVFQTFLEKDLNYLKKTYPTHTLKSSIESNFKIWIFQFKNFERSQYVNQFGDVIQKQENSFLRIWRYPLIKNKKQKVIQQEKIHQYYRTVLHGQNNENQKNEIKENQGNIISEEIKNKCQRINILNRFSSKYEQLLVQCRKNQQIGNAIQQHLDYRKKLYSYPKIKIDPN